MNIKRGLALRSKSDGHLWVVSKASRSGEVTYQRYENGWHVGICAAKDIDLYFERVTPVEVTTALHGND